MFHSGGKIAKNPTGNKRPLWVKVALWSSPVLVVTMIEKRMA
jgi:hypothetical protein